MSYENNNERNNETFFSKRLKAGKIRTYFFDVRSTRSSDYFITLTESKKRFNEGGYERHKIFLYKEDFNKFLKALTETIDYVKTDLMPDFDFDAFNHEYPDSEDGQSMLDNHSQESVSSQTTGSEAEINPASNDGHADVDTW